MIPEAMGGLLLSVLSTYFVMGLIHFGCVALVDRRRWKWNLSILAAYIGMPMLLLATTQHLTERAKRAHFAEKKVAQELDITDFRNEYCAKPKAEILRKMPQDRPFGLAIEVEGPELYQSDQYSAGRVAWSFRENPGYCDKLDITYFEGLEAKIGVSKPEDRRRMRTLVCPWAQPEATQDRSRFAIVLKPDNRFMYISERRESSIAHMDVTIVDRNSGEVLARDVFYLFEASKECRPKRDQLVQLLQGVFGRE